MSNLQERQGGGERFFSVKQTEEEKNDSNISLSLNRSVESDEVDQKRCLTLRALQYLLPCLKRKGVWEPSQGDLFKSQDADEAKYPKALRFLESTVFDVIFVSSCLLSIYLFLFSEGFLIESRLLWGVIHIVNAVYAMGLFSQWLQVLIKSKYAKTNHGYSTHDIVYTLLSVFPADLIVLAIYTLNDEDDNSEEKSNPIEHWMITVSRINYLLRIRSIMQYFSKWEDHLVVGDFRMFILRTFLFTTFLIHLFACLWHRLACESFRLKHFLMTPDEATVEVCSNTSWIGILKARRLGPLLEHDWNVLVTHYLVSVYWTIIATFRLGASDIQTSLISDEEVACVAITQITAWIFVLASVNGTLTSLFIEKDTEKENFLTRCFAIRKYLNYGNVPRMIHDEVMSFYNYLWKKSRGIRTLDLVNLMPHAMKSEVFYDVNKFVLDQLPMMKGLETPFLMSLSVHTNHRFHLAGEHLFKKNDTAQGLYYVVKGHLEILSDNEQHVITTIRSGSAIGEVHLLQPYPHVATVRCGSDCDILVLTRKHFRRVLNQHPQYITTLEQRLENRIEQSGLLLALCEKHNTYRKAFKSLREFSEQEAGFPQREIARSFENVTKILETGAFEDVTSGRVSDDFDGLNLSSDIEARINSRQQSVDTEKRNYDEILAAACAALEADVTRAGSLASDLNIPRPPLIVSAPGSGAHVTLGFRGVGDPREHLCSLICKRLKYPTKGHADFCWKFIVSVCALLAFWYYPYQFAFREPSHLILDKAAHIMDVIFCLDCIYDMIQVVVTPQRTFESAKDIAIYRFKSVYFYIRVFSFIPFEYVFAPIVGGSESMSPYFYLFKFNRLMEIHLVFRFVAELESKTQLEPILLFMGQFGVVLFYVIHIFAVMYMFVLRDVSGNPTSYVQTFYWSLVIVTSLGSGDFPASNDSEVTVEIIGLMVGVSTLIYMGAKVSAVLVNTERRRLSFKQLYFGLQDFMNQRKFPAKLSARVCDYYNVQWLSHQGTLIPTGRTVLWDAPKSVVSSVSYALANRYLSRIPLFMHVPEDLQKDFCTALVHYAIPPGEVILYPEERSRDVYMISKGFCEVIYGEKRVAVFADGRYFGLSGLLYGVNTQYLFRTLTHCHIFCLTYESFIRVISSKPNFLHEYNVLTGVETLTPYQNITIVKTGTELPYPSQTFLAELVERAKSADVSTIAEAEEEGSTDKIKILKHLSTRITSFSFGTYLLPYGVGLKGWLGFRLVSAVFVTIFVIAQLAYGMSPALSFGIILIFDIIAWTDMALSMRIAYLGPDNQLITDSWKMALHYLTGPFVKDLIACMPLDYYAYFYLLTVEPPYNNQYHIVALLRLNRMLQCYNLLLTWRILERGIFRSLSLVMLLEMMPFMFLFINIASCLSVLAVCDVSRDGEPVKCQYDAWIINGRQNLDNLGDTPTSNVLMSDMRSYVIGVYWVTQSILCVGFGDIGIGSNITNQGVAITVVFIGILVASYTGGKLTSCIVGEDPARTELQEKMNLMNDYLEQHQVSKNARRRVQESYFNTWDKTKGVSPKALFLALPPTLKTDVMKQLYESTLRSSPLFKDLDVPGVRILASSLTEQFYPEGEFLMKFGDLSNEIFFIAHGEVVCYNVRGDVMAQLGSGSLIGEISSYFHTHRLYTAIAVKDVNAYIFQRDSFMSFLEQYPVIHKLLEVSSAKHYKEAMVKKIGNADYDVLLTYQNEVSPFAGEGGENRIEIFSESGELIAATVKPGNVTQQVSNSDITDLTRTAVSDEVLKTAEDVLKGVNEKWWSVFVTFGRVARDEMGLVHIYQELESCNFFNFTIHPASSVCNWVSFCLVLTALSCGITAYEIAFSTGHRNEYTTVITLRYLLELFFIVRLWGNFHLGYYDDTLTLIVDVKTISKRYMSKVDGMWLDLITTIPFYFIADVFPAVQAEYVRSLQLLRVALFVRYLNETNNDLKMKAYRTKILKITILLCFIFHFWACAWYLCACYQATCTRGSWMHKTLNDLSVSGGFKPSEVTIGSRYLLSLYFVTNALTFTGFSDISARTNIELCVTITMMYVTVFMIGYLVGEMTQCLASQVATKIHYQHKLTVLEGHFLTLGLSYAKIAEVRHYFQLLWCRCKGVFLFNVMSELPYPLRADVAMEIYGPNLKSSRIIGKLDENLLRQIAARIRHEIYFPGSHIVRAGDVCTSMYFIKKGEVVILDGSSKLELCVEVLYENECFGEVKILLPREQYRFSYIARLESEVGVLHKEDVETILKNHPRIFEELREKATRVKSRRQSLKEEEERGNAPRTASSASIKSARSLIK